MTSRAMQFLKDKEHSMDAKGYREVKSSAGPRLATPDDDEMQFADDDDLIFKHGAAMS